MQTYKTYNEAIESLFNLKVDTIDLSLGRIKSFLKYINNPENKLKCIHIAGTNGKGSVLKYLETVLIESGYRVGSYTSPHLVEFTERIAINNQQIPKEEFTRLANFVNEKLNEQSNNYLTVFEILAAMAFLYFNEQQVDIVLLETGLGGRFDATNVIKSPLMSIITKIDIDHTDYLGDTIEKIGFEKAGIIKVNRPVIIDKNNAAFEVIQQVAKKNNSEVVLSDYKQLRSEITDNTLKQKIFNKENKELFSISMPGKHQLENVSLALQAIEKLKTEGYKISEEALKTGFEKTLWPGRAQFIEEKKILLDGAHNESGARALKELINTHFKYKEIIWVIGILKTKDYESILKSLIQEKETIILTEPVSKNAIPAEDLEKTVIQFLNSPKTYYYKDIKTAISKAEELKTDNSLIIITGSLYLVGNYLTLKT